MKKIIFTKEEINDIINKYSKGISTEKICFDYNVSPTLISKLLKNNKIILRGNVKIIDKDKVIEMYTSNNFTMSQICTFFNVSNVKIKSILLSNSIKFKTSKKYNYYDNIFEKINSEEKSYWLGFLYADGYVRVRKSGSELKLKLAIKDKDHLKKFKKFISPDDLPVVYEEYKKSKSFKISVNSNKIVNDLINLGCVNKKSKIIKFPYFLDKKLISHFIRGYFDGDGSISYSDKQITLNFVSGSISFLEDVSTELNIQSKCRKANLVGSSKSYKYISYTTKNDLLNIHNYLYNNSNILLERKKNKFEYIIDNFDNLILIINMRSRQKYKNKQDEKREIGRAHV